MKTDLLDFLNQLIETQDQMLAVLSEKQKILVKPEKEALVRITTDEEHMVEKMQQMLNRREELLTAARLQNIVSDSIEQLCGRFFPQNVDVQKMLDAVKHRAHQIHLLAYTNWTMSRKSMIHVSQILELLETRGQGKTTYHPRPNTDTACGGFVDRVA